MSPESPASHVRTAARAVLASARVGDETRELFLGLVHDASAVALGPPPVEPLADTGPLPVIWDEPEPGRARRTWEWLRREQSRLTWFAVNGSTVFVIGIIFQLALIKWAHLSHDASYAVQTAVSVQVAFALSRCVTWRDRSTRLARAWLRFNTQQALVTGAGVLAYAGLDAARVGWVASNIIVTVALIPASFTASHLWSLREQAPAPVTHEYAAVFRACARRVSPHRHPLAWVLTVQAALSLRLVWTMGAYGDEGLYIWAGHLEWHHWLKGAPIPDFSAYFSGAPAVYSPVVAWFDSLGGLTAARLFSLLLIMLSTCLLYATARTLFSSKRTAVYAAAVFTGTGASQFIGAFATYDSMALFFLSAASWAGVRAASCSTVLKRAAMLLTASVLLIIADASKYVNLLFDPVVIMLAGTQMWRMRQNLRAGIAASVILTLTATATIAAVMKISPSYREGIIFTTLSRQRGSFPVKGILFVAAGWSGLVLLLAIISVITVCMMTTNASTRALALILTFAGLVIPAAAVHSHLFVSMFKHLGYGEWFTAIPAGYALAALVRAVPKVKVMGATYAALGAIAAMSVVGFMLAGNQYTNIGPDFSRIENAFVHDAAVANQPVIASDDINVTQYYASRLLPSATRTYGIAVDPQWLKADPAENLTYDGQHGIAAFSSAIRTGYFTEVVLSNFPLWSGKDALIQQYLRSSGRYALTTAVPYIAEQKHLVYQIWTRKGNVR